MGGGAIGRVIQTNNPAFKEGDLLTNRSAFREYFVSDGRGLSKLEVDPALSPTAYMHALGNWVHRLWRPPAHRPASPRMREAFVSTAAGAVGSIAAQIAKIHGCYVVGSTGSDDKVKWLLEEAGLDAAINYKTDPIRKSLREHAPKGIDVDRQCRRRDAGRRFSAVMNPSARVAVCGMISRGTTSAARACRSIISPHHDGWY